MKYKITYSKIIEIEAEDEIEAINKAVSSRVLTVEQVVSCNLLKK